MLESTKELILSVFRSYKNEYPLTPHTLDNIKTVERMLRIESTNTVEDKVLEYIGNRIKEILETNTKSKLQENINCACLQELKMILQIYLTKGN